MKEIKEFQKEKPQMEKELSCVREQKVQKFPVWSGCPFCQDVNAASNNTQFSFYRSKDAWLLLTRSTKKT